MPNWGEPCTIGHGWILEMWRLYSMLDLGNCEKSKHTRMRVEIRGTLPHSTSAMKQVFYQKLRKRAQKQYEKSPRFRRMRRIDPTAPSKHFLKLTSNLPRRRHASILMQLRTGHLPLNHHLHQIGKLGAPTCTSCGEDGETVVPTRIIDTTCFPWRA